MRQPGATYDPDVKGEKPAPAPPRDIFGVWEPAASANAGVQADGAQQIPSDGKSEVPFTAEGRAAYMANKPTRGTTAVPVIQTNDPFQKCDPQGFPRLALHNFRTSRIFQTPESVVILYLYNRKWRQIWTDGRQLPKDTDNPRFWGYSVGRWADDFTFVVESTGFDTRTWLDNAGRPHSDALRVEERYRRVDREHLEMTVVIDDPKYSRTSVCRRRWRRTGSYSPRSKATTRSSAPGAGRRACPSRLHRHRVTSGRGDNANR
jgi:hypothetical protein